MPNINVTVFNEYLPKAGFCFDRCYYFGDIAEFLIREHKKY